MTIERNGQKIELTSTEVWQAFQEQERKSHIEDLKSRASDNGVEITDEQAAELVDRFDHALSNNDGYFECFWLTADAVLEEAGYKA